MVTESPTSRNRPKDGIRRFRLTSLGCKVNQYDANAVASLLRRGGWQAAGPGQEAELVVVVTCCVTRSAMRKSRQAIARAHRLSPGAAVAVLGCYGNYDTQRIRRLLLTMGLPPTRWLIAGPHDDLPECVGRFAAGLVAGSETTCRNDPACPAPTTQRDSKRHDGCMRAAGCGDLPATPTPNNIRTRRSCAVKRNVTNHNTLRGIDRFAGRQRAFVKVQDGCDAFCTYCIVPFTRCRVWSRSIGEIQAECRRLVEAGHREIVLSGVFLGAFGRATALRRRWPANEPAPLPELVARVAEIDGLWRLRLSSLEPGDLSDELLAVCGSHANVAPHFHLPLQSGADRILKRMNRQYDRADYCDAVDRLRRALDRPAISTDIIVGFPGEGDRDFAATLAMARYAGFSKIHAFPFSAIEPTAAWHWKDESPPAEAVRQRLAELAELESRLALDFRSQFVGQVLEAIVEGQKSRGDGTRLAMTDRYFRISFRPPTKAPTTPPDKAPSETVTRLPADLTGEVVKLRVCRTDGDTVEGVQV